MKKKKQKRRRLLSLKQWVHEFPDKFPVNYGTLDEDIITSATTNVNIFEKYAQCSAYKSKGYYLFMHHFPISKPELT